MTPRQLAVAGLDLGTECVKALVMAPDGAVVGRAVVPTRGYFEERGREALGAAVDEAGLAESELAEICTLGFGKECFAAATMRAGEAMCQARGAYHFFPHAMTLIDIGGRDPQVIHVDATGRPLEIFMARKCAVGLGTFLMYSARHLDVHPTRLQELAAAAQRPAVVGSYCSVFAGSDILDRLREGIAREDVALGCIHSIAERILEIGGFEPPVRVAGGVVEYFPGVMKALAEITGVGVEALPEPIMIGALGAALQALETASARAARAES